MGRTVSQADLGVSVLSHKRDDMAATPVPGHGMDTELRHLTDYAETLFKREMLYESSSGHVFCAMEVYSRSMHRAGMKGR